MPTLQRLYCIVAYTTICISTAMIIETLVTARGEYFPRPLFWSILSMGVALLFLGIETAKIALSLKKEVY